MNEYITICPCCNRQLKILIDESSGNIVSTTFFDAENQDDGLVLVKKLEEKGIYFG